MSLGAEVHGHGELHLTLRGVSKRLERRKRNMAAKDSEKGGGSNGLGHSSRKTYRFFMFFLLEKICLGGVYQPSQG